MSNGYFKSPTFQQTRLNAKAAPAELQINTSTNAGARKREEEGAIIREDFSRFGMQPTDEVRAYKFNQITNCSHNYLHNVTKDITFCGNCGQDFTWFVKEICTGQLDQAKARIAYWVAKEQQIIKELESQGPKNPQQKFLTPEKQ